MLNIDEKQIFKKKKTRKSIRDQFYIKKLIISYLIIL